MIFAVKCATYNYVLVALGLVTNDGNDRLNRLAHIHADVCHSVLCESLQDRDELATNRVNGHVLGKCGHSKQGRLSMQVVRVALKGH